MEHFSKKVKVDGEWFDSKKEADFYERFIKPSGKRYLRQEQFALVDKWPVGGVTMRGVFYRPDFVIYGADGREHVYDVKTSLSARGIDSAAMMRFKLFAKRYGLPVEVVVPRRHDFKMKVFGLTTNIQTQHTRVSRKGEVVNEYYDVFNNVDYDIWEVIGK